MVRFDIGDNDFQQVCDNFSKYLVDDAVNPTDRDNRSDVFSFPASMAHTLNDRAPVPGCVNAADVSNIARSGPIPIQEAATDAVEVESMTTGVPHTVDRNFGLPAGGLDTVSGPRKFKNYTHHFKRVEEPLAGTCEWILEQDYFQQWRDTSHDSILFLRSGIGTGKSVLSKFITEHLREHDGTKEGIIVPFYCDKALRDGSVVPILENILRHIQERLPAEMAKVLTGAGFGDRLDVKTLWGYILALRAQVSFTLFAIVDAVDESFIHHGGPGDDRREENVWNFVKDLCDTFGPRAQPSRAVVKVLLTSRPLDELEKLNRFPGVLFDIPDKYLRSGVEKFLDGDATEFLSANLSPDERDKVLQQLKRRSGSMYQYAVAALDALRDLRMGIDETGPLNAYLEALHNFGDFEINDVPLDRIYLRTLSAAQTRLQRDPQTFKALGMALRVIFCCGGRISASKLKYSVACMRALKLGPFTQEAVAASMPVQLSLALQTYCSGLITLEGRDVLFKHDTTVTAFLRGLSTVEWPDFSCSDTEGDLRLMAEICFEFLKSDQEHGQAQMQLDPDEFAAFGVWTLNWCWFVEQLRDLHALWPQLVDFLQDPSRVRWMIRSEAIRDMDDEDRANDFLPPSRDTPLPVYLAAVGAFNIIAAANLVFENASMNQGSNLSFQRVRTAWRRARLPRSQQFRPRMDLEIDAEDEDGNRMIHHVAAGGNEPLLKRLLWHGADYQSPNKQGVTPFLKAVSADNQACIWALIEHSRVHGALTQETVSRDQWSCLQSAAYHDRPELITWLLTDGLWHVDDDNGIYGWTPLCAAARHGRARMVKLLLELGASAAMITSTGTSAIAQAINNDHEDIVEMLLEADPSACTACLDSCGRTPLHLAAFRGASRSFHLLYAKSPVMQPDVFGSLPIHVAARSKEPGSYGILKAFPADQFSIGDLGGYMAIHYAAQNGNLPAVKLCLDMGCPVDVVAHGFGSMDEHEVRSRANTPLSMSISSSAFGAAEVYRFLKYEKDASLTLPVGHDDRSLLHMAAEGGNVDIIKDLLDNPFDQLSPDKSGVTPLHLAAQNGHLGIIQAIHERFQHSTGFSIDAEDSLGNTALLMASYHSAKASALLMDSFHANSAHTPALQSVYISCLVGASYLGDLDFFKRMLEQHPKQALAQNHGGDTPAHYAANRGKIDILKILVTKHPDILIAKNVVDCCPTHEAISGCQIRNIIYLIRSGSPLEVRDATGMSVLERIHAAYPFSFVDVPVALPQNVRRHLVAQVVRKLLRKMNDVLASEAPTAEATILGVQPMRMHNYWLYLMGWALKSLGPESDAEAKVLYEICGTRRIANQIDYSAKCYGCQRNVLFYPIHHCRTCSEVFLCRLCFQYRMAPRVLKRTAHCPQRHEYLTVCDDAWSRLPLGMATVEESQEEWLRRFTEKYLSIQVEDVDISEYEHEDDRESQAKLREAVVDHLLDLLYRFYLKHSVNT
jgi:ankyrin repeat protein